MTDTKREARFNIVMARDFIDQIETYAKLARETKAEFIRDAVRLDMRNRDRFGADYDVIMSLLERVPTEDIVQSLTEARKSL
jgi:hypothetical protein